MRVWTVANQKGGVGKTTTTVSLGGLSAAAGRPTLLVDLDPHGSMTTYFGYDPESLESGVYTLFHRSRTGDDGHIEDLLYETGTKGLVLLPASTALATLDRQLGACDGMGLVVARALQRLPAGFDQVIIDCPSMLGVSMVNALAACDHVVVPVQTEFLAIKGLERMVHTLDMIERTGEQRIAYTIVPTMFDRRTRVSTDVLGMLRERFSDNLWDSVIPVDTRFREASRVGRPINQLLLSSRGTRAYQGLLDYLEGHAEHRERMVAL